MDNLTVGEHYEFIFQNKNHSGTYDQDGDFKCDAGYAKDTLCTEIKLTTKKGS